MNDSILINVPRRQFLGWFASVASFDAAGIGRVSMDFTNGQLALSSDWGQTSMSYDAAFEGTVDISARSILTLVKRHYRHAAAPTPLTLCLQVKPGRLILDTRGVICNVIPKGPLVPSIISRPAGLSDHFLVATGHAALIKLMKKLFSGIPRREAILHMSAAEGRVSARCGAKMASMETATFGEGCVALSAALFRNTLDTYEGELKLELEGSPAGLRINNFKIPIMEWSPRAESV